MIKLLIPVLFVFDSVLDQYKTHKKCDKVVSKELVMLKYCHDRYKTQEMCDKAVDAYLPALNLFLIGLL